jgi:hypothetical protein
VAALSNPRADAEVLETTQGAEPSPPADFGQSDSRVIAAANFGLRCGLEVEHLVPFWAIKPRPSLLLPLARRRVRAAGRPLAKLVFNAFAALTRRPSQREALTAHLEGAGRR